MLVYRVENASGEGPYNGAFCRKEGMSYRHSDNRHPGPYHYKSLLSGISKSEYCGFNSIDNARKWFAGFIRSLDAEGFHLSVYESSSARVGRFGQTLFVKSEARFVRRMTLREAGRIQKNLD